MKKFSNYLVAIISIFPSINKYTYAQLENLPIAKQDMRTVILKISEIEADSNYYNIESNSKKLKEVNLLIQVLNSDLKLSKAYAKAVNYMSKNHSNHVEAWKVTDNLLTASIFENDSNIKVMFTRRGNWKRTAKSYPGTKASKDLAGIIKKRFSKAEIIQVQEVKERDETLTAFYVRLEDNLSYKDVLVYGGKVDLYKEVMK